MLHIFVLQHFLSTRRQYSIKHQRYLLLFLLGKKGRKESEWKFMMCGSWFRLDPGPVQTGQYSVVGPDIMIWSWEAAEVEDPHVMSDSFCFFRGLVGSFAWRIRDRLSHSRPSILTKHKFYFSLLPFELLFVSYNKRPTTRTWPFARKSQPKPLFESPCSSSPLLWPLSLYLLMKYGPSLYLITLYDHCPPHLLIPVA